MKSIREPANTGSEPLNAPLRAVHTYQPELSSCSEDDTNTTEVEETSTYFFLSTVRHISHVISIQNDLYLHLDAIIKLMGKMVIEVRNKARISYFDNSS